MLGLKRNCIEDIVNPSGKVHETEVMLENRKYYYLTHLKLKCNITPKKSVKSLPAPADFFFCVLLHIS